MRGGADRHGHWLAVAAAPVALAAARARHRPGRWIAPALGIALAAAFAAALAGEATVSGDGAARRALAGLSASERAVRVSWPGAVSPTADRTARESLDRLGLERQTHVVLLNPVRLETKVVRLAAITPLERGVAPHPPPAVGACRPSDCPLLLAGGPRAPTSLSAPGVHIRVVGRTRLRSSAALGFLPRTSSGAVGAPARQPPLLVGGDADGLQKLAGLQGIYRTDSRYAELPIKRIDSWDLTSLRARLQRAAAQVESRDSAFTMDAPLRGLTEAAAQADSAPRRMLLAAGGGLAVLAAFVILVAGALRRDVESELARMRMAGATPLQCALFAYAEAATPSAVGVSVGAVGGVIATAVLAATSGVPVGGALLHSLVTPLGIAAALAGIALATLLLGSLLLTRAAPASSPRLGLADLLAVAAGAALVLAVARGGSGSASDPLPVLLVPLGSLAAGVLAFRLFGPILRGAERISRGAPLRVRLAVVNLARAGQGPSLAVAFLTITVALGGFAIVYRATLTRGAADQAANRVPLDAIVASGPSFVTPLQAATLSRWRELAGGDALPVDRTEASYPGVGQTKTVPAIALPARGLTQIHGWRAGDGSAPLSQLASRLRWPGPVRNHGPLLPAADQSLGAEVAATGADVAVKAVLRDRAGAVRAVSLGRAGLRPSRLTAPLPPGRWELEALEVEESAGLAATNGHQIAENPAARTLFSARVRFGPIDAVGANGRVLRPISIAGWRAVGAADHARPAGDGLSLRFTTSGAAGVLRPTQPSDSRALPILVDPETASAAGARGQLPLTVDGVALRARVVGVLERFPTLAADGAGFVVADQAQLEGALDAAQPGAGWPNELWLSTSDPSRFRAALASPGLRELSLKLRSEIERVLRSDPVARGLLGGLVAAAAISLLVACLGLVVVLLGSGRDPELERDLTTQGLGPSALRADLRLRTVAIGAAGVLAGLGIAVALAALAVGAVRAATTVAAPRPPLVTVVPWISLLAWSLVVGAGIALSTWLAGAGAGRTR